MLSLLCGANPLVCKQGPSVRLSSGHWKLYHDGIRDTEFHLVLESSGQKIVAHHEVEFEIERPDYVHLEFVKRGSERYVSMSARKL